MSVTTSTSVACSALAIAVLGACSTQLLPPAIGDCVGNDAASCADPSTGSTETPGTVDSGGGGACNAGPSASECDVCGDANCCAALSACSESTSCSNLYSCVTGCAGVGTCIDACDNSYPDGVTTLEAVDSCLAQKCVICAESGAGDPCTGTSTCISGSGLTCSSTLGCTKGCTQTSDCAGIGPSGGNFTGQPNACIGTSSGVLCTPGCATNADCTDFPGTFCVSTTSYDHLAVSICSTLPDGG